MLQTNHNTWKLLLFIFFYYEFFNKPLFFVTNISHVKYLDISNLARFNDTRWLHDFPDIRTAATQGNQPTEAIWCLTCAPSQAIAFHSWSFFFFFTKKKSHSHMLELLLAIVSAPLNLSKKKKKNRMSSAFPFHSKCTEILTLNLYYFIFLRQLCRSRSKRNISPMLSGVIGTVWICFRLGSSYVLSLELLHRAGTTVLIH